MPNLDRFDGPPYLREPLPRRMTALDGYMVLGYDPADAPLCGAVVNDYDQTQAMPEKEETR